VDPALSTVVPSDTVLLAGIQVEEILKTQVYQKYLKDLAVGPADEFAKETGLNAVQNVWEILVISDGKRFVTLGRGKFSEGEAEPRIERPGATRFAYKGYTFVGDEQTAVMFLSPTVGGIGDTSLLKRVVDARGESHGPPGVLAARMKQVPYESEAWAVFSGSPITFGPESAAGRATITKTLSSIESGYAYLDLTSNISGRISGTAATDAAAKELHDALRGMLGLAQMMAPKGDAETQKLFGGVQITQDARDVNVRLQLPEDGLQTALRLLRPLQRQ
jgi:hypothetical protein